MTAPEIHGSIAVQRRYGVAGSRGRGIWSSMVGIVVQTTDWPTAWPTGLMRFPMPWLPRPDQTMHPALARYMRRVSGAAGLATISLTAAVMIDARLVAPPAYAQVEETTGNSYLSPFPEGDTYRIQVVGDAMAEGMLTGIADAFGTDSRVQLNKKHRPFAGLARSDADDEIKLLEDIASKDAHHITIIMVGMADRQPLRSPSGGQLRFGTDGWRAEYGRRVDRLIKAMKRRNGAVYWVGLPVVGKSELNDDIQVINDIARDRAYLNAAKYLDVFAGFADENGAFNRYGPDLAGKFQLLRATDGINFTAVGNRKLAHFPEREIKRDIAQARGERSIPLAGSEAEQRKVAPAKSAEAAPGAAVASLAKPGTDARTSWSTQSNLSTATPAPLPSSGQAEQRADNSRVVLKVIGAGGREETINIDLLRPAIPASVIQLMARNSPEKASQVGDTVQETVSGGLVVMSSITPANDGGNGGRSKLAPTQTPYFKVMVKGERLPPRAGRADDFRWPRTDLAPEQIAQMPQLAAPAPAVVPVAAPAPAAAKKITEPKRK
jgi:uncharacterized protein